MPGEYTSSKETRRGYITYFSEVTGKIKYKEIEYAIVNGLAVFEGDIVIGTVENIATAEEEGARHLRSHRAIDSLPATPRPGTAVRGCVIVGAASYRWSEGLIPYTIDSTLPNQNRVTDAIARWESATPIRFKERGSEPDYVTFVPDSEGCSSAVGRQRNQQFIRLHADCTMGNTIHEIGHAVGLWHEQSREDREEFVTINLDSIEDGYEHNFNQHIADGDDVGPYDYDSIMHYSRTAFSKDGSDTITPPVGVNIGQRNGLSIGDMQTVRYMYETIPEILGVGRNYVGNRRSRELHLPWCTWVRQMSGRNFRLFQTIEEAVRSGYNGCYYCLRYFDTDWGPG